MNENESKNFGIFKEISGYLGSLLGICAKLQLATLLTGIFQVELLITCTQIQNVCP